MQTPDIYSKEYERACAENHKLTQDYGNYMSLKTLEHLKDILDVDRLEHGEALTIEYEHLFKIMDKYINDLKGTLKNVGGR